MAIETAKDFRHRSEVFEKVLQEYLPKLNRKPQKRKLAREEEIKLTNRYADEHRGEILENLEYQISKRKKQFLESLPQIFDDSKQPQQVENEE